MRVPLSWLREWAALPDLPAREVASRLIAAGLEVESVTPAGHEIRGVTVGEVLAIEELSGFKKPIRYCQVRHRGAAATWHHLRRGQLRRGGPRARRAARRGAGGRLRDHAA